MDNRARIGSDGEKSKLTTSERMLWRTMIGIVLNGHGREVVVKEVCASRYHAIWAYAYASFPRLKPFKLDRFMNLHETECSFWYIAMHAGRREF